MPNSPGGSSWKPMWSGRWTPVLIGRFGPHRTRYRVEPGQRRFGHTAVVPHRARQARFSICAASSAPVRGSRAITAMVSSPAIVPTM